MIGLPPINIVQNGAVGDGVTMCTVAIQKSIDAAAAGSHVVLIPAGHFLTGTLKLRSHVELRLAKGAVLLGSASRKDYEKSVWYSLLIGDKLTDVAITGNGTIDGQGVALAQDVLEMVKRGEIKIPAKGWRPSEIERPEIIEMNNCHRIRLEGVTIKNGCCWIQTYRNCTELSLKNVKVDSKAYWNNDGIDVVDCRNVGISNSKFDVGDDGICLKSDDPKSRCENVIIKNCRVRSSASAIKFGTSSHGGFKHVRIDNVEIKDTFRSAVALESVDGGTLEDIEVSHIHAVHTGNAFFIRLGHRTLSAPAGRVRNIYLHDFEVQIPAGRPDMGYPFKGPQFSEPHNLCPSSVVGLPQAPVENVRLERIHIRFAGGGTPAIAKVGPKGVPERVKEYPEFTMFGELPAWGLYMRHVRGVTVKDCSFRLDARDYRPAFAKDDVKVVWFRSVRVKG